MLTLKRGWGVAHSFTSPPQYGSMQLADAFVSLCFDLVL